MIPSSSHGHPAARRGFLKTMAAATCGIPPGAEGLQAAGGPAKTGVKMGACGGIRGIPGLTKLSAKGYYNWGAKPPVPPPAAGIEWIPIIFPHGVDKIASACERVKAAKRKVLLGYNEPDHNAHQLYGKPIWITEFAMQDKQATKDRPCRYTKGDALHFMREVLPELDKLAWVERYCWYSPHKVADVRTGPSCLLDDASELTALGEYFKRV